MSILPTSTDDEANVTGYGITFWITAAVGAAIVVFGVHGLWVNERRGFPSAAKWLVGGALAFDLVIVPLGAVIGWGTKRVVPEWAWPVVRAVLFISIVLIAFAAPLVLNEGGVPSNFTVRPRDYLSGLLKALAATWAAGLAVLAFIGTRRRIHSIEPDPTCEGPPP